MTVRTHTSLNTTFLFSHSHHPHPHPSPLLCSRLLLCALAHRFGGRDADALRGSQFVVGFPHKVLSTFIRSFPLVKQLAVCTQTDLAERYLKSVWAEMPPELNPTSEPSGEHAIARMRLVVQAQSAANQIAVNDAFNKLSASEKEVLSFEMALTGVAEQEYKISPCKGGPAFSSTTRPRSYAACARRPGVRRALHPLRRLSRRAGALAARDRHHRATRR